MARLTFPDEGSRLVFRASGLNTPLLSAAGGTATVYSDAAGTLLADIQTEGGAPTSSQLTIDAYSRLPLFLGPDGADTVWVSVAGGPIAPVYARNDDRIDAVKVTADAALPTVTASATYPARADGSSAVAAPLPFLNVKDFGAIGDGVADDTAAIQTAINACIPGGTAATTVRHASAALRLPPGTYKITAPLRVESVIGFDMRGSGTSSILYASGTFDQILDLNGIAYSSFGDFSLRGTGTHQVVRALWVRWNQATALRSVFNNRFFNIDIFDLTFTKAGFEIGQSGDSNQVDTDRWSNCMVNGAWAAGNITTYQNGFYVGSDMSANNLLHHFEGCASLGVRYGLRIAATEVSWYGGAIQGCEVDIKGGIGQSLIHVSGIRSEGSQRLYESGGPGDSLTQVSLENIDWYAGSIAADGEWIRFSVGGTLYLKNIAAFESSAVVKKIVLSGGRNTCIVDGVATATAFASAFVRGADSKLVVNSYSQMNAADVGVLANTSDYRDEVAIGVNYVPTAKIHGEAGNNMLFSHADGTTNLRIDHANRTISAQLGSSANMTGGPAFGVNQWAGGRPGLAAQAQLGGTHEPFCVFAGADYDTSDKLLRVTPAGYAAVSRGITNATYTTAGRPSPVPAGTQVFDTTLNKPIWWDGTNWKDAAGTVV